VCTKGNIFFIWREFNIFNPVDKFLGVGLLSELARWKKTKENG